MSTTTKRQLPPDPRTAAEMIPVRLEEIKRRDAKPECPNGHGVMPARPLAGQTYEQLYCGVWYDCKLRESGERCMSSASYASRELAAYHGEPYVLADGTSETWTGTEWQPITTTEFDAYWAQRMAETKRREAAQVAAARKTRRRRTA